MSHEDRDPVELEPGDYRLEPVRGNSIWIQVGELVVHISPDPAADPGSLMVRIYPTGAEWDDPLDSVSVQLKGGQVSREYSDPKREKETYALPDVEVFYRDDFDLLEIVRDNKGELHEGGDNYLDMAHDHLDTKGNEDPTKEEFNDCLLELLQDKVGWYWWTCLSGCMPDSEASGPFDTEAEALADAREEYGTEDEEDEEANEDPEESK